MAAKHSPREIRERINSGRIEFVECKASCYPRDWSDFKRKRMKIAVECATLFYFGYEWWAIKEKVFPGQVKTKSRIQQYVVRGTEFMLDQKLLRKK